MAVASLVSVAGILLAYALFLRHPVVVTRWAASRWGTALHRFWFAGWGFDWAYEALLVRPYVRLARRNREDGVDAGIRGIAWLTAAASRALTRTETGHVRWYAMGVAGGAAIVVAILVFL
jgi:NADH-quinone oxidoreductase subunit L